MQLMMACTNVSALWNLEAKTINKLFNVPEYIKYKLVEKFVHV